MKLASIFTDHMVFQAHMPIRIFGEGKGNVKVSFLGKCSEIISYSEKWCLELPSESYGGPYEMEIKLAEESFILKDVYIGEVWIAGGQSNMELPLHLTEDPFEYAKHAYNEKIRFFTVPRRHKADSYIVKDTPWMVCSEETVIDFSALGYFTAKKLNENLNVAVGIISCNWGSMRIEPFISRDYFKDSPALLPQLDSYNQMLGENDMEYYENIFNKYQEDITKYREKYPATDYKALVKKRGVFATASYVPSPPEPTPEVPEGPFNRTKPGALFDSMFSRIIPYSTRGFMWYQGESNGSDDDYLEKYGIFMKCMRDSFKNPDMPFYAVELASFSCRWDPHAQSTDDRFVDFNNWATLREQQQAATEVYDNNYLVTTMELGDINEIHPYRKKEIAHRMALKILKYSYGFDILADQPLFESVEFKAGEARIKLKNAAGLFCKYPDAVKMYVSDESHILKPGNIRIENEEIIVSNEEVQNPTLVRYGFDNYYAGSHIYNDAGLPLAPFRTDK